MILYVLSVALVLVIALQQYLAYHLQVKWMRLLSEKEDVPSAVLDGVRQVEKTAIKEKPKARITIPIPGADLLRQSRQ
jgi:hypothetical protein